MARRWISAHDLFTSLADEETEHAFHEAGGDRYAFDIESVMQEFADESMMEPVADDETTGLLPAMS